EALETIEITFAKSDFEIKDVKDVNVFYLNPKDLQSGQNEDEIVEIIQRKELVDNLQKAGKSTANLDEEYDVSSVEVKENQRTGKIVLEGRKSTIYGCYVEKEPEKEPEVPEKKPEKPVEPPVEVPGLTYEDDEVVIKVTAEEEGVIPEGAELKVLPITSDEETKELYEEVGQKIQDKITEEEKEVAGFLAYDIGFVDKDGNELEPNGKVKVSMNYKKAEIPQEVVEQEAKDAEVTVFHLEEDEKGEVKDVVDMRAEKTAKVDTLVTTEGQKVQNVEAETESFSVFAVTWEAQAVEDRAAGEHVYKATWKGSKRIANIHFRNDDFLAKDISQELGITEDKTIEVNKNSAISTTIGKNLNGIGDQYSGRPDNTGYDYVFKEARLDSTRGTVENYISYNHDFKNKADWYYVGKDDKWKNWPKKKGVREVNVYLIYEKKIRNEVGEIKTIEDKNIDIDLFNYNAKINNPKNAPGAGVGFKFHSDVESYDGKNYLEKDEEYTNPHNQVIQQNYVKRNLKNNCPELTNGKSLGYLFGQERSEAVTSYNNLSGLLYKDSEGYNVYDSETYHAQLLPNEDRIAVYNAKLSPDWKTFGYGNFLPFNELPYNASNSSENSVLGKRFNSDMWFGMNIGFTFIQPKNGLVKDKPMIFDFRGDDDVWVFIDGVKVLDIGGIHDKKEGSIDFSTGTVKVEDKKDTTLAALYRAAYVEKHGERGVNDYLASIFKKDDKGNYTTYKNFSGHNFEFFYLERGGGAANCRIRFNMPSIDPDDIIIRKEIENYDEGAYSDVEFSFELYVNNGLQKGAEYTLIKADGTEVPNQHTDSDTGRFKLKHGESAKFSQYNQGSKYYVKEVGISSEIYDHVTIESSGIVNENDQDISQGEDSIQSKELIVGENPMVTFLNRCALSNMKHLIVEKVLTSGTSEESYDMRVTVGGELYNGPYKIGKDYDSAMAAKEQNTENGIISLEANQVAVVLGNVSRTDNGTIKRGIPSGTSFKVEELLKDNGQYLEPTYEIVKDTADAGNTQNGFEGTGFAEGKIALKANAKVVVTNSYNATLSV
ncbi:MAG: fibro-slime domain-containing protein, partial [Bacillota bacterium]|nr:fibro-slime domain-containing protein [Bacillota bacterium]